MSLPEPLARFFAHFPLKTYPAIPPPYPVRVSSPTIWILPPHPDRSLPLSLDIECLKWQAYMSLRLLPLKSKMSVRWDIAPEGAVGGRLPNLHLPPIEQVGTDGKSHTDLLASHMIPGWVDSQLGGDLDPLEGYPSQTALDESHAWVSLLEGPVHAALLLAQPPVPFWDALLSRKPPLVQTKTELNTLSNPPPAPISGLSALWTFDGLDGWRGTFRVSRPSVELQYKEAISALSERLGTDKWFFGAENPTPLDALLFAYLHSILHSGADSLRIEVTRRVNLVAWEWRVRGIVGSGFVKERDPSQEP